ncbi:MAG: hypothetical protein KatS3mg002_0679 [Candidatus Woesearchaeota archaeon]|nr:MAG: hypothetical protein KatS3mg002_0679 [Candidatus Woesearchaeota archaeon]
MKKGPFQLIRETSFIKFFIGWIISIIVFGLIYFIFFLFKITSFGQETSSIFLGLFNCIYVSITIALFYGIYTISGNTLVQSIVYLQAFLSFIFIVVIVDKIVVKYIYPHYHTTHYQDKKINTLMLMMSIFRGDVNKLIHVHYKNKKIITIKDIESIIDGLYVVFLDIEKMLSERNIHRHKIKKIQYLMLIDNISDCLTMLEHLLIFLEKNNITWRDKNTEFWIKYIIEAAEKIAENMKKTNLKTPRILIALENITEYSEKLKEKIS